MRHSTKGFITGTVGFGLVVGGITLVLWADTPTLPDHSSDHAQLRVEVKPATWQTLSDRQGAPAPGEQQLDLRDVHLHPGETLQASFPVTVALAGDHLVTRFMLLESGQTGNGTVLNDLALSYEIFDSLGRPVTTGDAKGAEVILSSPISYHADQRITVGPHGRADITVVVTVAVSPAAKQHELTDIHATLVDAELELRHDRDSAYGSP